MMTPTTVRDAVLSADPAGALDRLVRAELAVGRTTAAIFAALLPIARELRKAHPLSADADQILLGTLDALTGNCNPDECYQDPPANTPATAPVATDARPTRLV